MSAKTHNIIIDQGSTFKETIPFYTIGNTPRDFTGWSFRAYLSTDTLATTLPTAEFVVGSADPTTGNVELEMEAGVTTVIPTEGSKFVEYSNYIYSIEIFKDVSGVEVVERICQGNVKVSPSNIKPTAP
jgi:hypothetical protein